MVGRKRKNGKRERNGRIQRDKTDPKIVSLSQPHRQSVPIEKRHDQKAENPFGRLNLTNTVTDIEYDAGLKFRDDYLRYARIMGIPSHCPRSVALDGLRYGSGADISPEQADARKSKWRRALAAVGAERVKIVLNSVVIYEKELVSGELVYLRIGLSNLVDYYGLTRGAKRATS